MSSETLSVLASIPPEMLDDEAVMAFQRSRMREEAARIAAEAGRPAPVDNGEEIVFSRIVENEDGTLSQVPCDREKADTAHVRAIFRA